VFSPGYFLSASATIKQQKFKGYHTIYDKAFLIDFFLNNQPDAPIIQIYSVIKLYMFRASSLPTSGVFYCTFGTGKFHAGF
jgi:hypothetical protein